MFDVRKSTCFYAYIIIILLKLQTVRGMSAEQRKVLLFFWTSVKYLPIEGFGGLASRLYIYKSTETRDRLPSSHTCFYRLCFPPYPSLKIMQDRLRLITQEHVGCSFGTWWNNFYILGQKNFWLHIEKIRTQLVQNSRITCPFQF